MGSEKPMKLYANVMVHNELPFLDFVTERLLTFCDHLVIMDNGSTDGSREWIGWLGHPADRITAILNQQTDPPHYADLRNRMLQHVPDGAWVLKWDPDELPSDKLVSDLRDILEQGQYHSWKILVYHLLKSRTTCLPIDFGGLHLRLFRKMTDTKWQGAVHEQPTVPGPHGKLGLASGIAVIHFSYFAEARLRRKALHYATISGSGFRDPTRLTDRLSLEPVALPQQITFQASDAWLEIIRRIK